MATLTHPTRASAGPAPGRGRAGLDLAAGLAPLLAVAVTTRAMFHLPASYLAETVGLYGVVAALVIWFVPAAPSRHGLGAANRVTLVRATLLLPVAALVLQPAILSDAGYWWIIGVSTIAMIVDGMDGWMARRTGTTDFGARFDMELDAFLMLALSVLVWLGEKVGPWVILIGALRYLFVAAGWLWPALAAELPPSLRRKTICVVQDVVLLVCLGPIIPSALASGAAAAALAGLVYSFCVDARWLMRRASA